MGNVIRFGMSALLAAVLPFAAMGATQKYRTDVVVPASPMHGAHGIAVGADGALYVCSLTGHSIYRVDRRSGEVTTHVGPPRGTCDDLAFGPDGTLAWTAGSFASVFARAPDGRIDTLATEMPGLNSINYSADGRLFVTRIFGGDGLYEIDPAGKNPPRAVAEKIGGLNGFEIKDSVLYGPLFLRSKLVKIDIQSGAMTDLAAGFMQPSAVNFDPQGRLIALDYPTGEVMRLEADGSRKLLATLAPPVDNLAIAPDGKIYVTSSAYNGVTEIDPDTLATRQLTWGNLSAPGTIAVERHEGKDELVVADSWGPRTIDPATGKVLALLRTPGVAGATSMALDGERIIYTNVWPFGVIQVVDRTANKLLYGLQGFGAPYDTRPVPDGFIVADFTSDRLTHVSNDAEHTRRAVAWNLDGPVGLADAGGGLFYVTEYGKKGRNGSYANGVVSRVDTKDGSHTVIARRLNRPEGIAIAGDGKLIVAETGAKRVVAVDPTGKAKPEVLAEKLAIGLDVGDRVPAPFLPTGVAIASDGVIYVTGDIDNVLYRISKTGK